METISNIAGAASKAIWGESEEQKEPLSGATGNTAAGEPYDAGNLDSTDTQPAASSANTISSIGPIVDARDPASKTVTVASTETGIGPVVDARGSTGTTTSTAASKLPSAASHTTNTESTAGGTGTTAAAATGGTYLKYGGDEKTTGNKSINKEGNNNNNNNNNNTTSVAAGGKLPQPSSGQSLSTSHAVGTSTETAPALEKVKAEAPLDGINPETGKPFDGTRTGSKDDPTASAGGMAGGASEGDKAGKHSKLGALKDKVKAKLHKKEKA